MRWPLSPSLLVLAYVCAVIEVVLLSWWSPASRRWLLGLVIGNGLLLAWRLSSISVPP